MSQWATKQNRRVSTSFLSFRLVSITMVAVFCSHTIRQKSATVSSFGPWREREKKRKENQYFETVNHPMVEE